MTQNIIRVIILSGDVNFKTVIAGKLSQDKNYEIITNCFNVTDISTFIVPAQKHMLLIDVESVSFNEGFLRSLKEKYPINIITLGRAQGLNFFKEGIENIILKPLLTNNYSIEVYCRDLITRINGYVRKTSVLGRSDYSQAVDAGQKIIAIASSTGGTEALLEVLKNIPVTAPPILVVQHMPSLFTKQYAERLDRICEISVKEASDGDYLKKGEAYIAPGDLHMRLVKRNSKLAVECFMGDKMHGVRPAADILFNSISSTIGGNVIGVILTGMGSDGAKGLYELHQKGAKIIGQNKETCVVYGMPKVAKDIGAVDYELPLDMISSKIMSLI